VELLYKAQAQGERLAVMSHEPFDEITTTTESLRLAHERSLVEGGNARARKILEALIADAVLSTTLDVRVLERITKIVEETV
jgi:hypothetical protein